MNARPIWYLNFSLVCLLLFGSCRVQVAPAPPSPAVHSTVTMQRRAAVKITVECADKKWYGSGAIVGVRTVITARHVADCGKLPAKSITAETIDGQQHEMIIKWLDGNGDTAMLQLKRQLPFARFRWSHRVPYVKALPHVDQTVCIATAYPVRGHRCGKVQMKFAPGRWIWERNVVGGNSGSAMYDPQGRIVGVITHGHHCVWGQCFDSIFDTRI